MTSYAWDALLPKPRMPEVGQTVNGQAFVVPRGSQTMTIHIPTLVSNATLKLQVLDPVGSGQAATETWRDLNVFNLSAGGVQPLSTLVSPQAVTLPISATGSGTMRLVASSDQSSVPVNISIVFARL